MNLRKKTLTNSHYRLEVQTLPKFQLVLMSLKPKEEIGMEVHPTTTQFIYVEKGVGQAIIEDEHLALGPGCSVLIPPGNRHNIINESSQESLQLFTIYVPPEHKPGTVEKYKFE